MIRIELPWPPRELSPNARPHFMAKSRVTRKARQWAQQAAWAAGVREGDWDIPQRLKVTTVFCPPDKRPRDSDNMFASCKAYRDGVADALGINDKFFENHMRREDPCKGGAVFIELEAA
jgi:crossover junction endodeoxyribonuclease RusA